MGRWGDGVFYSFSGLARTLVVRARRVMIAVVLNCILKGCWLGLVGWSNRGDCVVIAVRIVVDVIVRENNGRREDEEEGLYTHHFPQSSTPSCVSVPEAERQQFHNHALTDGRPKSDIYWCGTNK